MEGSGSGKISADGRYVAIKTRATNLVDQDTNGLYDIIVHDAFCLSRKWTVSPPATSKYWSFWLRRVRVFPFEFLHH